MRQIATAAVSRREVHARVRKPDSIPAVPNHRREEAGAWSAPIVDAAPLGGERGHRFADVPARAGPDVSTSLKARIEQLAGISLDDVAVHYDSPHPERIGAHAFTQGNHIHVGAGQERHLAHEAWHVVQQKQGRVPVTARAGGHRFNLDASLEREADVMGARALHGATPSSWPGPSAAGVAASASAPIQGMWILRFGQRVQVPDNHILMPWESPADGPPQAAPAPNSSLSMVPRSVQMQRLQQQRMQQQPAPSFTAPTLNSNNGVQRMDDEPQPMPTPAPNASLSMVPRSVQMQRLQQQRTQQQPAPSFTAPTLNSNNGVQRMDDEPQPAPTPMPSSSLSMVPRSVQMQMQMQMQRLQQQRMQQQPAPTTLNSNNGVQRMDDEPQPAPMPMPSPSLSMVPRSVQMQRLQQQRMQQQPAPSFTAPTLNSNNGVQRMDDEPQPASTPMPSSSLSMVPRSVQMQRRQQQLRQQQPQPSVSSSSQQPKRDRAHPFVVENEHEDEEDTSQRRQPAPPPMAPWMSPPSQPSSSPGFPFTPPQPIQFGNPSGPTTTTTSSHPFPMPVQSPSSTPFQAPLPASSGPASSSSPKKQVVEVGAGTAKNSAYMRNLVLQREQRRDPSLTVDDIGYTATDIAPKGGPGHHLEQGPPSIPVQGQVDANQLGQHFAPNSVDTVVGVNPFGDWTTPGASYGVRQIPHARARDSEMTFDPRMLQSAQNVLKDGGKVRMFGRTSILKKSTHGTGPFVNASPQDLQQAAALNYDVHVRRANQSNQVQFQRPDSLNGDGTLGPFNTELVFRKRQGPGGVKLHDTSADRSVRDVDSDEELDPGSFTDTSKGQKK